MALLTSCAFTRAIQLGEFRIALRRRKYGAFLAGVPRASEASRRPYEEKRDGVGDFKFEISDFWETATAREMASDNPNLKFRILGCGDTKHFAITRALLRPGLGLRRDGDWLWGRFS
jgi:hypothetical protein